MSTKKLKLDGLVVLGVMMIMLSLLVALNSPPQAEAASACTANITNYWKFDEITGPPFADSVAGVNNAVCTNCPSSTVDGRIKNALLFGGLNSAVNVPAEASFDWSVATGFSMEFWMKTDVSNTCTGTQVLMGRNDTPASSLLWYVGCSGGKAEFYLSDKSGISADILGVSDVTGGQWHHIVAVRDAGVDKIYVYVDGVKDASTPTIIGYASGFDSAAAQLNIGWLNLGSGYYFAGTIDEVALYNRALSSNEIKQHYYDGSVGLRRGYCGCASPVKIMPLGDSITAGDYGDTRPFDTLYGFRKPLYESLVSSGFDVDFVGSLSYGTATFPPVWDTDHEGHMGFRANGPDPNWSIAPNVNTYLTTNPADVVLLHIGTNDITHGSTTVVSDVATILDNIDSYSQDVTVVLARIINRTDGFAAATTQFNIDLAAMATSRIANGDKIIIVDQESALNYATDMFGPLHPNDSGYNKMANVWLKALSDILPVCGTGAPLITSNPIPEAVVNQLYVYDVHATGNPSPTYSLVTSPPNMTIDPATGVISWTPNASGPVNVVVQATNSAGADTQSFTIQVSVCPSDMTHYWKLDETTQPYIDLYGNNDATCTNCPSATAGTVGGAQEFNLTSQVNVADDNTFDWSVATGFSMEFWMKTDVSNTCTGTQVLMGRNDTPASSLLWYIGCSGGKAEFYLSDKSGINADILGASDVTGGQWHHIVAVRDAAADKIYVYVDGVQDASTPTTIGYTSGFDSAAAQLNIGWLNMGPGYHFAGAMDEVALYNRALSAAEIQSHYNSGTGGSGYCGGGHSITGTIKTGSNAAISGVTVTLSGAASATTATNASGVYTFTALANGGYTVTPSLTGYTFSPVNRAVNVNNADVTGQDFTGTLVTYSITGTIKTGGGAAISGVTVTLSGAASASTTTNASGVYTFTGLANGSYTVTPSLTGYTFSPVNRAVAISGANATGQDFTGTPITYSITGTVKTSGGAAISGVTVTLSGAASASTTTNASGVYTFTGLANGSYTVTPTKAGSSFTPTNRAVTVSGANVTAQDFTQTGGGIVVTYAISGAIQVGGSPSAGVAVALSGAASRATTTDSLGRYSFTGLANGNYTVTPSMTGCAFTPTSRAVTISGANATGQDFTGTASAATYTISGTVRSSGSGPGGGSGGGAMAGVTVALSGAASATTTTNASGVYTFTGLSNGSYTVTPSLTGYTFSPVNRTVNVNYANVTAQDFTGTVGTAVTYTISGAIQVGGGPLAGVTVALSGAASRTITTDSLGRYSFTGLANGGYTVTPSMTGYTFTPTSRAVTISGANATGQDFTGTASAATYTISGKVRSSGEAIGAGGGGSPVAGVTVALSGAASRTTTTDSLGRYSFTGLANGGYTVTPSMTGYTFTPTSRAVTISGANATGQDFTR